MMPPSPSPELLKAIIAGDARSREELFDVWLPVVMRWCARLGGPRIDIEDAAHDAFMVVLTRLDRLADLERFPAWLYGIVRRILAQHRRRAWVRRWVPGPLPEIEDPTLAPDRRAELSDTARRVQRALSTLPSAQREVLVLSDLDERTAPEIAMLLEIPVGTVTSRLRLARQKFAKAAAELELAPDPIAAPQGGRT